MERAQRNTADHFNQFLTNFLSTITNVIQIASLVAILIYIEPVITLVLFLIGLPYLVFQWRFAKTRYLTEQSRTVKRRWTTYFISLLTGQKSVAEVKLLGLAPLLVRKFRILMENFRDQDRKLYLRSFAGSSLFVVMSTTAFYGTFAWVVLRALRGTLTVGDVAVYGGITARLSRAIETTINSATGAFEQTLYISNMIEFLKIRPKITGVPGIESPGATGEIEIRNITFTYVGSTVPALSNVSLHIRPGETVALVGENGAGKTTLVKLIARLYDPDEGSILLDGADIRHLPLESLHRQLSFVFQGFGRYEATAADNVAYGDWKRLMNDREKVEFFARLADANGVIEALPEGYDTLLGRMFGEFTLSDGQWQKIAVARALAREGSLLILDEPTSSMDARAEYQMFSHFREIAKGRTTILISHRFSTVSIADRILMMHEGEVIEQGTHRELIDLGGRYATLYDLHRRQMTFR
jgi:ATP-binding cassette subfamily B protein